MKATRQFDVIIVGGSYSGLAAGMALGRSLRAVLIIDSGKPCNRQTPYSHNFITQDGKTPKEIATIARQQVEAYPTVHFLDGLAVSGAKTLEGFEIETDSGELFGAKKLIFATGVKDLLSDLKGFFDCWGISVLHCPYCHGYEVRNEKTGILGNGEYGFEFSTLISNWTNDLTLFTNGPSTLTPEQRKKLESHHIKIEEKELASLSHKEGWLEAVVFKDGSETKLKALYAHSPFEQHSKIPERLGCALSEDGYINIDLLSMTTVPGIYACGDNTTRMRTVANAVSMGTKAGIVVNKEIVFERF